MSLLPLRLLAVVALVGALLAGAPAAPASAEDTRIATQLVLRVTDWVPVHGQPAVVVAQLVAQPKPASGGLVQFSIDGTDHGEPMALSTLPTVQTWIAVLELPTDLSAGDHELGARFLGNEGYAPSSGTLPYRVDPAATTTTLAPDTDHATVGDDVTFTADVDVIAPGAGSPTGTVQLLVDDAPVGEPVPLDGDHATITSDALPAGVHAVTASYSGDGNFTSSTSSPTSVTVAKRATALTADPALVRLFPFGLPLGLMSARLTGPDGPVADAELTFSIGGKPACTATTNASGVATCAAGSRLLELVLNLGYTASYAGSAGDLGASARAGIIR